MWDVNRRQGFIGIWLTGATVNEKTVSVNDSEGHVHISANVGIFCEMRCDLLEKSLAQEKK